MSYGEQSTSLGRSTTMGFTNVKNTSHRMNPQSPLGTYKGSKTMCVSGKNSINSEDEGTIEVIREETAITSRDKFDFTEIKLSSYEQS